MRRTNDSLTGEIFSYNFLALSECGLVPHDMMLCWINRLRVAEFNNAQLTKQLTELTVHAGHIIGTATSSMT
jgi:hypothetical protein